MEAPDRSFAERAAAAIAEPGLRRSLDVVERVMPALRRAALAELPDAAALREQAAGIRASTLAALDTHLCAFEQSVRALGGEVHWAPSAADARDAVVGLCRAAGARRVVKSKSMVTEEIGLNEALTAGGLAVTETDLGEYIIQLRGERPSHILAPALHLGLDDVADTFREHHAREREAPLGSADSLLAEARAVLRERFLDAEVAVTGANFLIAETGGVCIVTNEGNADLAVSLAPLHIVVTGIEKVVPTLEDATVLLRLLARSVTGESLSNYTTFIHGPPRGAAGTPRSGFHVVLVDNGRSALLGTEFQDMLRCIRCSACINHCPVFTTIGGHAYGSVYPGPMGAVLTPAIIGLDAADDLPQASTLCGRCEAVCPVGIPLVSLLRSWRRRRLARPRGRNEAHLLTAWRWLNRRPFFYRNGLGLLRAILRGGSVAGRPAGRRWLRGLPWLNRSWLRYGDLEAPEDSTFQAEWRRRRWAQRPD